MSWNRIGNVFFDSEFYTGKGSETTGSPALTFEVLSNRRKFRGKLTEDGIKGLDKVMKKLQEKYPNIAFKVRFNKHAGCSMCPCSPGYSIYAELKDQSFFIKVRIKEGQRFNVYIEESGTKFKPAVTGMFYDFKL